MHRSSSVFVLLYVTAKYLCSHQFFVFVAILSVNKCCCRFSTVWYRMNP